MTNYQNAKIYKLSTTDGQLVYYGSTFKHLNDRLNQHKSDYRRYLNGKFSYNTSFQIIKTDDYSIELVEKYPCISKLELETRERYWIENNTCINKVIPTRTKKEYYQANRTQRLEYQRQYQEYHKTNQKFNCECGGRYIMRNKVKHEKTNKHQTYLNKLVYERSDIN